MEVLSPAAQKKIVEKRLNAIRQESKLERMLRVIEEYDILSDFSYGEQLYSREIEEDPQNV